MGPGRDNRENKDRGKNRSFRGRTVMLRRSWQFLNGKKRPGTDRPANLGYCFPAMPTDPSSEDERENPSRSAAAYRDYLAERDEILRHKWSLSEAAGQDVGFETALLDWVHHHRPAWRRSRSRRSQDS